MVDYHDLARQSDQELAHYPLAVKNLLCAIGLPGVEHWDIRGCLDRIKHMAQHVGKVTEQNIGQFERHPERFDHSEGRYRMLAMVTVLQEDFGIRYNPAKIPEEVPLSVADTFVYGAVMGEGGTCASLPVLYVSVGEHLHYPLQLVSTKTPKWSHLFVRWHAQNDRFNIKATSPGFLSRSDDGYRITPYQVSLEEERAGRFLRNMTPREELAIFLRDRFHCWQELGDHVQAVESISLAWSLVPGNLFMRGTCLHALNAWKRFLNPLVPPRFPILDMNIPKTQLLRTIPFDIAWDLMGTLVTHRLVNDPRFAKKWWEPLRRGLPGVAAPKKAVVEFRTDGKIEVSFQM